jgi:hypothetical protein
VADDRVPGVQAFVGALAHRTSWRSLVLASLFAADRVPVARLPSLLQLVGDNLDGNLLVA